MAPLDRANVDTDQIIPKQFLKSIRRTGFGDSLFFDWRYLADGRPNPDFVLNQSRYKGASILLARNNFGCGSSREHAVWAVMQAGFRAIIAPRQERGGARVPGFADIFRNNAEKNGLLPIELAEDEVGRIFELIERFPGLEATVDLEAQRVVLHHADEVSFRFGMDATVKRNLLQGLDDIGLTMEHLAEIERHEVTHPVAPARA